MTQSQIPTILLVDPNPERRQRYLDLLLDQGFEVEGTDSISAAKAHSEDRDCDILLTQMFASDGPAYDFASRWSESGRNVVAFTDLLRGPTVARFFKAKGLDVIEEPVDDRRLVHLLRRMLKDNYPTGTVPNIDIPIPLAVEPSEPAVVLPSPLDLGAVKMSGTFATSDIVAVLARLVSEQANGALMLQHQRVKKLVFLEDGVPVGIKSNLLTECLGQLLVADSAISAQACDRSLAEMRRTHRRQGEVLVDMGALTAEALDEAVARQLFTKFEQLFTWSEGAYKFKVTAIPAEYHGAPIDDPANLIWQALEHTKPFDRASKLLADVMDLPASWTGKGIDLSRLGVPDDLRVIFDRVDGERTTAELIATSAAPDRIQLLLYALTAFGTLAYLSPVDA